MRWASSISVEAQLDAAVAECSDALDADLDGTQPDLVAAFVSPHFSDRWTRLPSMLARRFPNAVLLGCSGNGVLGGGPRDRRRARAGDGGAPRFRASVSRRWWCGRATSSTSNRRVRASRAGCSMRRQPAARRAAPAPHFVLLPDPFSCPAETLIARARSTLPRAASRSAASPAARASPAATCCGRAASRCTAAPSRWRSRATSRSTPSWRRAAGRSGSRCS